MNRRRTPRTLAWTPRQHRQTDWRTLPRRERRALVRHLRRAFGAGRPGSYAALWRWARTQRWETGL